MTENELILWSAEYTERGIREYCDVESEIITGYYSYPEDNDEILEVLFKNAITSCKKELCFDDLLEEVYGHNTDRIRELAFLYTLDDIRQSGKEIHELSEEEVEDMVYSNEVGIEESMYYNSSYSEPQIVYNYACKTGLSYVVNPDDAYGSEEYETLFYDNDSAMELELPAIVNSAQQVMFDELLYGSSDGVSTAKYGDFYIVHDKGVEKYARIESGR